MQKIYEIHKHMKEFEAEFGSRMRIDVQLVRSIMQRNTRGEDKRDLRRIMDYPDVCYRRSQKEFGLGLARRLSYQTKNKGKTPKMDSEFELFAKVARESSEIMKKACPAIVEAVDNFRSDTWERVPERFLEKLRSVSVGYRWDQAQWLHNVHISTEDPRKIAYYPSFRHMLEKREVRTTVGKYLKTYESYYELAESEIKMLSDLFNALVTGGEKYQLKFIEHDDAAGWRRIYSTGPQSCMKGEEVVELYAHKDSVLRLAYLDSFGDIVARCIVREDEQKGWLRCYPEPGSYDAGTYLKDALAAAGYESRTNLNGVLIRTESLGDDSYKCPYIDHGNGGKQQADLVGIDGKLFLELGTGGYDCTNTDGTANFTGGCECECDRCGSRVDEDYTYYVEDEGRVCDSCIENYYVYAYINSTGHQEYIRTENAEQCSSDGEWYTAYAMSRRDIYWCDATDRYWHIDDLVSTSRGMTHVDYVVYLDHEDADGNSYAHIDDIVMLTDGNKCHEDDAERLQELLDIEAQLELELEDESEVEVTKPIETTTAETPSVAA